MTTPTLHRVSDLIRYVNDSLPDVDHADIKQHVETCAECKDFLGFLQEFNSAMKKVKPVEIDIEEPCPGSSLIVALEEGNLDEETAQHLRVHMLYCTRCLEEFFLLRQLSSHEREGESQSSSWQRILEKLEEYVIDLCKSYIPGSLIGPVRVLAETPAFALRRETVSEIISIVLEVSIRNSIYSVELGYKPEGIFFFDIAGFSGTLDTPLTITVTSEAGGILNSLQTDHSGNAHLTLPIAVIPDSFVVISLSLFEETIHLPVRLPLKK
ncbi:MAG TPA: hypothetical protein VJ044_08800 [Candidatus Hodarchaeales archaeon]|nr:hypothetical protein [Candidatus Hodarchaeales archaeon]